MKRIFAFLLVLSFLVMPVFADEIILPDSTDVMAEPIDLDIKAKSCLLMEAGTGTVLYAENETEALPPASVTKIMSLLLVFEAINQGRITMEDIVQVSEYAAGKGGSQVYLEAGEQMSVHELIKCVAVASANDATTALAEYVAGSEDAFVTMMNEKAAALGMENTTFLNCTGLDDDGSNMTCAKDIALMSRALMAHEKIFEYTTIWMDTIRNGEFGLSNTNKLVRFYSGTNGLKTGSTSNAGFCISATAKRDDMQLIAVIMGSESSAIRNEQAKKLLDHGFANYAVVQLTRQSGFDPIPVEGGQIKELVPYMQEEQITLLVGKSEKNNIKCQVSLIESVTAPVEPGQTLGKLEYYCGDKLLHTVTLVAECGVEKVNFGFMLGKALRMLLL